jgi:hypothetical protein
MRLKTVVLDKALPREQQPTQESWTQIIPSARYTSDTHELSYDPATALVTLKGKHSTRLVHVSAVLFMEAEASASMDEATIDRVAAEMLKLPDPSAKRRGMPKGGWPKKVTEVPINHLPDGVTTSDVQKRLDKPEHWKTRQKREAAEAAKAQGGT